MFPNWNYMLFLAPTIFFVFRQVTFGTAGIVNWAHHKPNICVFDDNFTRPGGDNPMNVYVSLILSDLYDISEEKMEFAVQTYFLEFWYDPSLKMENVKLKIPEKMPLRISDCIWKPDTVFVNSKDAKLYDITFPNINFKIMPNGFVYRLARYRLLLSCHMDFKFYPMDTQLCYIAISFLSTMLTDATLGWTNEEGAPSMLSKIPSISIFDNVKPLQFSMQEPFPAKYNLTALTGKTHVILCYIPLHRHLTASLVNTYIPSFLVVNLSWISFWLDANAIPGRVTLGVTALLTLSTEIVHARSAIPSVEYMTAMDIWLFGCLVMVFMSLIEFTMAQAWARKPKTKVSLEKIPSSNWTQSDIQPKPTCTGSTGTTTRTSFSRIKNVNVVDGLQSNLTQLCKVFQGTENKPEKFSAVDNDRDNVLDRVSRCLFPGVMIIFTITYCAYYSSRESAKSAENFFSLKGITN